MRKSKREIYFRTNYMAPPRNLPFTVRSVGHYVLPKHCRIDPPTKKWLVQMFWITEGHGDFRVGQKIYRAEKDQLFFYLPGETHELIHCDVPWSYRWLTFDHPETPRWMEWFGLDERPTFGGKCPEPHFEALTTALRQGTAAGDRAAAQHAHAILLAIVAAQSEAPPKIGPATLCKERMDNGFADPNLTVERIADDLGLHRSTLFRLFRRQYTITPSRYLHNLRIRQAIWLLQKGEWQVQEVALMAGFADPNYFSRAIREATGYRPHEFHLSDLYGKVTLP